MIDFLRSLETYDYAALARRFIDRPTADRNSFSRVESLSGAEIVGRNGAGNYAGIVIPNRWPGEKHDRAHRIRRDHPEIENGKPKGKYMASPGASNLLYFPHETDPFWLQDECLPVVMTEGEFKTVALFRAAQHNLGDAAERPRFLPIGLSGVWNWRGVIGKTVDESGTRVDEKGPIPDLSRVAWVGRTVVIAFDRDVNTNEKVQLARALLTKELRTRGAVVKYFEWPAQSPDAKGIDDLLAAQGPDFVLQLIEHAPPAHGQRPEPTIRSVSDIPSIRAYAAKKIEFAVEGMIAAAAVTAVTGDAGSGKTTWVTAICGCVNRGQPFAGLETQRRPVLMLDRDNSLPSVIERFERLHIEDGQDFRVWGGWNEDEAPAPGSPIVLDWVRSCDPKPIVVVDCLAAFLEGDENDARAVRMFMQGLRRLADLGATVIILHHSGKGESTRDYRGSSDFKASIDIGFTVTNLGDSTRLSKVKLKAFKSRFIVETDMLFHYEDGGFRLDDRPAAKTNAELLRELLIANVGITKDGFEKLAVEKNIGRNQARAFIDNGVLGHVIRRDKVGNAHHHTLVENPDEGHLC